MRIIVASLLLTSLAACGTQPVPLDQATEEVASTEEPAASIEHPSSLSDAGADLVSIQKDSSAETAVQSAVKTFHLTASHAGFNPIVIEVNEGDTAKLTLESIDARHSFSVPALGVRAEIPARDTTTLEFIATRKGQFEFLSDVYSGAGTSSLRGVLIIH